MTRAEFNAKTARIRQLLLLAAPLEEGDDPGLASLTMAQRELERLITRVADDIAQRDPPPTPDTWTPTPAERAAAPVRGPRSMFDTSDSYADVVHDLDDERVP